MSSTKLRSICRRLGFLTVCASLFVQVVFINGILRANAQKPKQKYPVNAAITQEESAQIQSKSIQVVSKSVVNVRSLAAANSTATSKAANQKAAKQVAQSAVLQTMPAPGSITEVNPPSAPAANNQLLSAPDIPSPLVPSPAPSQNFQGGI